MTKKLVILLIFFSSFIFSASPLKVTFLLGKPVFLDGKKRIAVQPNQILNENGSLFLPKGSLITLEINGQRLRVKGENQFKIKDLINNIGQFEKFLDSSSKRKEISDRMLLKLQPTAQLGVRAAEEKGSAELKWADDADENTPSDKEKAILQAEEKIKADYLKGEYEGVLFFIKENHSAVNQFKSVETLYYIGASFYFLGGYESAVEFFEKALEKNMLSDSLRPACFYLTALSYEGSGNYKKTAQILELFLIKHNVAASEPEVYLLLAKAYSEMGNIEKKNDTLLRFEEKFSNQPIDPSIKEEIKNLKEAK